jgi:competence protein ComEC
MLVEVFAQLTAPRPYGNEGAFDYPRYLAARGIEAVGTIKSGRLLRAQEPAALAPGARLMRRVDRLRGVLLDRLDRAFPLDPRGRRAAAVAAALLLGERGGLTLEEEGLLQEAGLSHLLAVSGFNVAVLALSLLLLCRLAGLSSRGSAISVIPCLGLYLLINRDESSVERAVIMAVAALAARMIWRRPDPLNTLGLSALTILAASPLQVFDSGFQLTYAATLSLIVLVPRLSGAAGRRRGPRARAAWWAKSAMAVTLAAWVGTFPLCVLDFNRIAPGALPANLVAGPLMAAAFVGVLSIEAAATVSDDLSAAIGWLVQRLVDVTFETARAVRSMPFLSYRRVTPEPPTLVLYYLSLWATLVRRGGGRLAALSRLGAMTLMTGSTLVLLAPIDTRARPEGLRVTAIDVGQGDAILLEAPSGLRLLVDAGGFSRGGFDVGERVVGPALWRMGIARLDYLAVTHADTDHAGGAAAVVESFGPRSIWVPAGASVWPEVPSIRRLKQAASAARSPLRELSDGDGLCLRGACVRTLNPAREGSAGLSDNDRSLVLVVSWMGRSVLLAADAGALAEQRMASGSVSADVLKVGHHGSATATTERFTRLVSPRVALISCGARNRFGHPDPAVVARLEGSGARVCRTDRDGAVTVELLGGVPGATRLSPSCALRRFLRDPS